MFLDYSGSYFGISNLWISFFPEYGEGELSFKIVIAYLFYPDNTFIIGHISALDVLDQVYCHLALSDDMLDKLQRGLSQAHSLGELLVSLLLQLRHSLLHTTVYAFA